MTKKYTHLSIDQRYQIEVLLKTGITQKAIANMVNVHPSPSTITLTFDNDMPFSKHEWIAKTLKVDTYFARPYTSQNKGTVENRIGVIRHFFPKKTDLRFVTEEQVKAVETKIHERPIRKFNYLNAKQVLHRKIALIT